MYKRVVIVDFDSTLANSTGSMVKVYKHMCSDMEGYKYIDGDDIYTWDGKKEFPLLSKEKFLSMFEHDIFWDTLELKEDAVEVMRNLNNDDRLHVQIMTVGSPKNIQRKIDFIEKHFGFIEDKVYLCGRFNGQKNPYTNDAIILDDHQGNLQNPNAINVLFKDVGEKEFNRDFNGIYVESLKEFEEFVFGTIFGDEIDNS